MKIKSWLRARLWALVSRYFEQEIEEKINVALYREGGKAFSGIRNFLTKKAREELFEEKACVKETVKAFK